MRRWFTVALLALGLAAGVVVGTSVIGGDGDQEAIDLNDDLTGVRGSPFDSFGVRRRPGDRVLAKGAHWIFVVSERQALELRGPRSASAVSAYTRPVTLNEATAFTVPRDGAPRTLVAGPVDDGTVEVVIETATGGTSKTKTFTAHDLRWFFAELPGTSAVSAITARGSDGEILDEYTLPPMPPNRFFGSVKRGATAGPRAGQGRGCPSPLPLGPNAKAQARRAALAAEELRPRARWRGQRIDPDPRVMSVTPGFSYHGQGGSPASICGRKVARRTIVVGVLRRGLARRPQRSASLSQGVDFVARFPGGYRVWQVAH